MAEKFALFVKFLEMASNELDAITIANYFWRRMTDVYKRSYSIVSGDVYHLNMFNAVNLFRQVVQLRKMINFSEDLARELWDNATIDYRMSWSTAPDEMCKLTKLFEYNLSFD